MALITDYDGILQGDSEDSPLPAWGYSQVHLLGYVTLTLDHSEGEWSISEGKVLTLLRPLHTGRAHYHRELVALALVDCHLPSEVCDEFSTDLAGFILAKLYAIYTGHSPSIRLREWGDV